MRRIFLVIVLILGFFTSFSQVLTREDSLTAGLIRSNNTTVLSGYGQIKVEYDTRLKTAQANLTRNVLFVGHRFSKSIYFFSELELEDAKVVGGQPSGEMNASSARAAIPRSEFRIPRSLTPSPPRFPCAPTYPSRRWRPSVRGRCFSK